MAEMIPDRLPANASRGEKEVFQILQNLADDCIVYYEPVIAQRYPDFIVIIPRLGVLLIEVKGWRESHILQADHTNVSIFIRGNETHKHPMRQVREYMYKLMDECKKSSNKLYLINNSAGEHEGKFIFPFGSMVVLNNIEKNQLQQHKNGDLTKIFPDKTTIYKNQLDELAKLSSINIELKLKSFFDPWWSFPVLSNSQINSIRAVIHPEINLSSNSQELIAKKEKVGLVEDFEKKTDTLKLPTIAKSEKSEEEVSLKVLDLKQEKSVRNIGDGHRLIRGVAGSGKTILLIARAKLLSQREDKPEILVLCYSVPLAYFFKNAFSGYPTIKALHFDAWAKSLSIVRKHEEINDDLGQRLLQRLKDGCEDSSYYKAIMVDESQDFSASWFSCVVEALDDGENGDLLIVGDANQKVFKNKDNKKIIWKNCGVNVVGGGRSTILRENYRNTKKILELAKIFSGSEKDKAQTVDSEEEGLSNVQVDVDKCLRVGDFKPVFIECKSRQDEVDLVVDKIRDLLQNQLWQGSKVPPVKAKDIGILYRHARGVDRPFLNALITQLKVITEVVWLSESSDSRDKVNESGIKIQTTHSAKGLQYAVVFVIWADLFPAPFDTTDEQQERNLFYVALTRPEDYLMITSTGSSSFTEMVQSKLS